MNESAERIQESELCVMRVLWRAGDALPLSEIRKELHKMCGWEDSTTKTLLRRLQAKGAVELVSRGYYKHILTENEYNAWASRNIIDRLYYGSAKNLVASLFDGGQLSAKDIAELREYLEAVDKND